MLVIVAICSLTFSLATRFSVPIDSHGHGIRSIDDRSGEPKRQHLDRDNTRFAGPVAGFTCLQAAVLYGHIIPAEPSSPSHSLAQSLYNRPPPAFEFFL